MSVTLEQIRPGKTTAMWRVRDEFVHTRDTFWTVDGTECPPPRVAPVHRFTLRAVAGGVEVFDHAEPLSGTNPHRCSDLEAATAHVADKTDPF